MHAGSRPAESGRAFLQNLFSEEKMLFDKM